MSRIERLAAQLEEPLLVTSPINVRYLTGFESSNAAILVEDGVATLFTDFRYLRRARELEGVSVVETPRAVVAALAERLSGRRVGIEADTLTVGGLETLRRGGVDAVPRYGQVESLRAVKEATELATLGRAAAISDAVFESLARERFTGRTELDLVWRVEQLFHEYGAVKGMSFRTIVAAGPTAASPHADPGDREIEAGTLVIVDAGCVVDGYASDCTRTFATGELPERLREIYDLCLEAQLAGLAAVRAGVSCRDADAASRGPVEVAGLGDAYGHGMGHGIGLQVHEAPALRPESNDVLQAGNVHSVEPGIYLEGVAGVRIEDMVAVTENGCERLTKVGKELVTVE